MAENDGEQRPEADPSQALERSGDPTAEPAEDARSGADAADADREPTGEREGEAGARPVEGTCDSGVDGEPDLDESFDRDGLVVIAAIFSLIGLAVLVEYFW